MSKRGTIIAGPDGLRRTAFMKAARRKPSGVDRDRQTAIPLDTDLTIFKNGKPASVPAAVLCSPTQSKPAPTV